MTDLIVQELDNEFNPDEIEDEGNKDESHIEPTTEPNCPVVPGSDEDNGIECEFEPRYGHWWCTTHNCWA